MSRGLVAVLVLFGRAGWRACGCAGAVTPRRTASVPGWPLGSCLQWSSARFQAQLWVHLFTAACAPPPACLPFSVADIGQFHTWLLSKRPDGQPIYLLTLLPGCVAGRAWLERACVPADLLHPLGNCF